MKSEVSRVPPLGRPGRVQRRNLFVHPEEVRFMSTFPWPEMPTSGSKVLRRSFQL